MDQDGHIRWCYECTTFIKHNLTVKIHEDSVSHSNAAVWLQPIPVECAGSHPHSRQKLHRMLCWDSGRFGSSYSFTESIRDQLPFVILWWIPWLNIQEWFFGMEFISLWQLMMISAYQDCWSIPHDLNWGTLFSDQKDKEMDINWMKWWQEKSHVLYYTWELNKRSLTGAFTAKVLGYAIISLG